MYRGFNVKNVNFRKIELINSELQKIWENNDNEIITVLDDFILDSGSIDGKKLREAWFPKVEADVFLSHAHIDCQEVEKFASWLFTNFGLVSFIDSQVWRYCYVLQEELEKEGITNTSHVHTPKRNIRGVING